MIIHVKDPNATRMVVFREAGFDYVVTTKKN